MRCTRRYSSQEKRHVVVLLTVNEGSYNLRQLWKQWQKPGILMDREESLAGSARPRNQ